MKKISFSQLFNPEEYRAPLLSSQVKKKILKRTIGAGSLVKRILSYSGIGVVSVFLIVFVFYWQGNKYIDVPRDASLGA